MKAITPKNSPPDALIAPNSTFDRSIAIFLWLAVAANSVFLIWQCLDRYLAPRFFFLSLALTAVLVLWRRALLEKADWQFRPFDMLLLGWYGLNFASAWQAMSWSEGIFFAQKTLLLFTVYWLFRQALHTNETHTIQVLSTVIRVLTQAVLLLLLVQIGLAFSKSGLDNETLYSYATGVYGNKGLASDFLFLLLALHILLKDTIGSKWLWGIHIGLLLLLILILQTRTVYLAVAAAAVGYSCLRAILDTSFRRVFIKKWLPAGIIVIAGIVGITLLGNKGSLQERLNPLTYLESASANERRFVWYKTDLLNAQHYWWGVGNGSWKFWLPSNTLEGAYRLQEKGVVFTRAHNDYLEIRAEMGMIGAVYFIALFAFAALSLILALRTRPDKTHEILSIGAGLLGYCIIQYFDFPRERIEMQVMLALFFAFSAHYGFKKPFFTLKGVIPHVFLGGIMIGLIFNTWIGWNRVSGEIHNVRMAKAYQKQDYPTVLREAEAARNPFLEYNDVALPFEWYIGTAQFKTNQMEAALQSYARALELNPWSFQILNNYASALATAKRYKEAIPFFEQTVRINPKYDEGKFNLAYSHTQLGNFTQALEWLAKVDTIANPKTPDELKKNKSILNNKVVFEQSIRARMQTK